MHEFIDERKKTVVFLGKTNEQKENQFYATGVLVVIQKIFHLVTAKHVIVDPTTGDFIDSGLKAFFNLKDGTVGSRSIDEIKKKDSLNWIFHENKDVDIAIIPFKLEPQKDDVKTVPDEIFLTIDRLFELYDVFFLSYQPGIQPQKKISPIARNGTISLINDDKTFYIDGSAFPGNSGSPVFLKPSPIRFEEGNISIGNDQLGGKFLGIIGEYIPYQEVAISVQTHRQRIVFEENTGLSKVWSIAYIKEITESEVFKKQLNKLVKK
jgi:hypothetical protein